MMYQMKAQTLYILLFALVGAALFGVPATARPAKDILHFKNGDKWTCEIKKLDHGYLYVSLDYVDGTVNVDWRKIESVESSQLFVVTDADGVVNVGSISTSNGGTDQITSLTVHTRRSLATISKSRVASIQETESNFWHDFHGGVSAGFNFAKSDNQTQYTLNANLDYIKRYWLASSQLQSSFSGSLSAPSDLHNDLSTYVLRTLNARNYVAIGLSSFLRSDEQQLALRAALGGGGGKILKNTESSRIILLGGAVWSHERYQTSGTPTFNSAEGLAGAILEYFRFKTTNLSMTAFAYPGLSDVGRIRVDSKASIKYELIKNLYLNFSLYLNYDSKPPRPTSKSDYGASSSVGWTF
jgi:putative salt-induced outer membrane protein YdiY